MIKKHIIAIGMAVVAITTSLYTLTGCQHTKVAKNSWKTT